MAAEILQQVACRFYGFVDVEALYRARRVRCEPVRERKHHRGLVVKLGQARGYNTDDALVPVFCYRLQWSFGRVHFASLVKNGVSLFGNAFVEFFAVFVYWSISKAAAGCLFESRATSNSTASRPLCIRPDALIDSRPDFEYHIVDCNFLAAESAGAYDCPQTHIRVAVEAFEAHVGKHPVLVDHGHDVSSDTYCHKVKHTLEFGCGDTVADREGLHEFISNATTRQMRAWVGRPFEFGVEYSGCRGQLVVGAYGGRR